MNKQGKNRKTEELWAGLSVVVACCYMLCIYAPTELYCYNQDEFWFDFYELFPVMLLLLLLGLTVTVALCLIAWRFFPKLYRIVVLPAFCIAFLCTYIQGNFLIGDLPPLDGSEVDWGDYASGRIATLLLWLIVTAIVVVAYKKMQMNRFAKVAKLVSIFIMLMLTVTMISILFTTKGYERKTDACLTTKDEYVFSEDKNFIVFVIDAADAESLSTLMEENPEYKDIFEDFTFYENMMGAYSCTMVAIPQILSGEWYENEKPFEEYDVAAYKNSPILDKLETEGYKLGMYEYDMPYEDRSIFRFSNVRSRDSSISSYPAFAKLEIKLVGLRYAPFDLKKKCLFNTNRFGVLWERKDEYPPFLPDNLNFYERMVNSDIEKVPESCFKFIHIEGAHVPFQYDENLNIIENGTYKDNLKASLTITKTYLNKLKESGVYDNSVIVVMADHGFAESEICENRQNPMFLVKGIEEHHELEVSQAPVSYVDLQKAFSGLADGKAGGEIFDYQEGDVRERRYLYYIFYYEDHMYEYTSTGHASDDESMVLTGREYILEK